MQYIVKNINGDSETHTKNYILEACPHFKNYINMINRYLT